VNVFEKEGARFYFGDLCGRYAEEVEGGAGAGAGLGPSGPGTDHTEMREVMLRALVRSAGGAEVIGLPEALSFRE
jgi:hypothetical protein